MEALQTRWLGKNGWVSPVHYVAAKLKIPKTTARSKVQEAVWRGFLMLFDGRGKPGGVWTPKGERALADSK